MIRNEVLDSIDFQQEKREEMLSECNDEVDCCAVCGEQFKSSDMVYQKHDNELVHERCLLDYISDNAIEYGELMEYRRDKESTEEVF